MSACERCWSEASALAYLLGMDLGKAYHLKLEENRCTPEEQAGRDARKCPVCHRMTLHQYTGEPMCGCFVRARTSFPCDDMGAAIDE